MYYLAFGILAILMMISLVPKQKKIPFWFFLIPLTILTYLRFGVGADYFSYEYIYNNLGVDSLAKFLSTSSNIEVGFKTLFLIGRKIGFKYHTFITILATIINFFALKWMDDNKINVGLGLLLYYGLFYFAWTLNAIRQGIVIVVFSYLYFNPKYNFNWVKGILIAFILSFFHVSGLILIPFIIALEFKFDRKIFLVLFVISLGVTFIPVASLLENFKNISIIAKASPYFTDAKLGFLDVPGMTRIVLFLVGIFSYNFVIEKNNSRNTKKIIDFYLLSFIFYFCLKSVEIVAARLAVYGYFQIIILLPMIYKYLEKENHEYIKKVAVTGFITCFSALGVYKELNATIVQSGYLKTVSDINKVTIYNFSREDFLNRYSHSRLYLSNVQNEYKEYITSKPIKDQNLNVTNENKYLSVRFPNRKYGIIDTDGNVILEPTYSHSQNIYGSWIELTENNSSKSKYKFHSNKYQKINNDNIILKENEVFDTIGEFIDLKIRNGMIDFNKSEGNYEATRNSKVLRKYFPIDIFDEINVYEIHDINNYKVMEFYVFERYYYVVLDTNNEPIIDSLFTRVEPFNEKGIMIAENAYTKQYINREGEIIWMEKK